MSLWVLVFKPLGGVTIFTSLLLLGHHYTSSRYSTFLSTCSIYFILWKHLETEQTVPKMAKNDRCERRARNSHQKDGGAGDTNGQSLLQTPLDWSSPTVSPPRFLAVASSTYHVPFSRRWNPGYIPRESRSLLPPSSLEPFPRRARSCTTTALRGFFFATN